MRKENEKREDGAMDNLKTRIANARAELKQAWEKYGETNELVLAAAVNFDRLLNEYMRLREKSEKNR